MINMSEKVLIADDDSANLMILKSLISKWGYEVITAKDGTLAMQILLSDDHPRLVILDWLMPGLDGIEVCKRVRKTPRIEPIYIIFLTSLSRDEDIIEGMKAGADDYITKPCRHVELQWRLKTGAKILDLRKKLAYRSQQLENVKSEIKLLQGLLPICACCKKVRGDSDYLQKVRAYMAGRPEARFDNCICSSCFNELVEPEIEALQHHVKHIQHK
jgi:PleD family two-component response regulator